VHWVESDVLRIYRACEYDRLTLLTLCLGELIAPWDVALVIADWSRVFDVHGYDYTIFQARHPRIRLFQTGRLGETEDSVGQIPFESHGTHEKTTVMLSALEWTKEPLVRLGCYAHTRFGEICNLCEDCQSESPRQTLTGALVPVGCYDVGFEECAIKMC